MFSRNVRLILLSLILFGFTFFGVFSTLFNLYLLRLGHGPEFIGLINGAAGLMYGLSCLPAGALGRRLGARRMMVAGMGALVIGLVAASLTEFLSAGWQRGWVLAGYLLAHLGFALYFVNISPLLMASTGPEERDHAFSTEFALVPLGGFVGSLVGGWLPEVFAGASAGSLEQPAPYRCALLAASVCLALGVWTLWAVREVSHDATQPRGGERRAGSYAPFVALGAFYFLWIAGEQGIRTLFNVYLDAGLGVPTVQIGVLLAMAQFLSVPAALIMPVLSARWGQERTIAFATAGMSLSILVLGVIPHRSAAGVGYLGLATLASVTRPALTILSQQLVEAEWRSVMSGSISMIAGLGSSAASTTAGYVVSIHGYSLLFSVCAGVMAVGVLIFWGHFCLPLGRRVRCRTASGRE